MDIVLIAGLWLDGSAWDDVVPELEQLGHRGIPLTLPGQGDGADRRRRTTTRRRPWSQRSTRPRARRSSSATRPRARSRGWRPTGAPTA